MNYKTGREKNALKKKGVWRISGREGKERGSTKMEGGNAYRRKGVYGGKVKVKGSERKDRKREKREKCTKNKFSGESWKGRRGKQKRKRKYLLKKRCWEE